MGSNNLSQAEHEFIIGGCREDIRTDGRCCQEYRRYVLLSESSEASSIDSVPLKAPLCLASGSSRLLEVGRHTADDSGIHLLCGIHPELVHPSPLNPTKGMIELQVDALGVNTRQERQQLEQLSGLLNHLVAPYIVDLDTLCVVPNETVWLLHIDIFSLQPLPNVHGMVEPCSHLIRAALNSTRLPLLTTMETPKGMDIAVNGDWEQAQVPQGATKAATVVTLALLGDDVQVVWDGTADEHAVAHAHIHVSLEPGKDKEPNVCAIDTTGCIQMSLLPNLVSAAMEAWGAARAAYFVTTTSNVTEELPLLQGALLIR